MARRTGAERPANDCRSPQRVRARSARPGRTRSGRPGARPGDLERRAHRAADRRVRAAPRPHPRMPRPDIYNISPSDGSSTTHCTTLSPPQLQTPRHRQLTQQDCRPLGTDDSL